MGFSFPAAFDPSNIFNLVLNKAEPQDKSLPVGMVNSVFR